MKNILPVLKLCTMSPYPGSKAVSHLRRDCSISMTPITHSQTHQEGRTILFRLVAELKKGRSPKLRLKNYNLSNLMKAPKMMLMLVHAIQYAL